MSKETSIERFNNAMEIIDQIADMMRRAGEPLSPEQEMLLRAWLGTRASSEVKL